VSQLVKNLPAMWETWVGKIPWGGKRLPTPIFLPGEFQGLYSPWGHKESDKTERLSLHFTLYTHTHTHSSDSCPLSWWCHPTVSSSVVNDPRVWTYGVTELVIILYMYECSDCAKTPPAHHWLVVFIFSENYVSNYSLFFLFWLHRQKKTLVWWWSSP